MTKVIVNNEHCQQIFNSYTELKRLFNTTDNAIREAENKGTPLRDNISGLKYYVDKLFTEEDIKNDTH